MSRESALTIGFALVIAMVCGVSNAAAQTDKYPRMAAIGQYLMEKNAEIQLARSAAPDSISRDATILVLGRQGCETAVEGQNGFVCMVERGWLAAFDWPEILEPEGESRRLTRSTRTNDHVLVDGQPVSSKYERENGKSKKAK